jgi:hypothetical protein
VTFTGGLDTPPTVTTTGWVPGGTEALPGGWDTSVVTDMAA